MSAISTKIYAKDSSGTLRELQPETTISNVSGLQTALDGKVSAVSGKGLSTNDYTTTEKNKLAGIADNANNYVHPTTSGNKHIPSGGSSGQFLKWSADGTATWAADNNTWTAMVGATSSANGSVGYVNAVPPKDGYNTKYLRADGTWQVPPNTTYSAATQSANGLMSSTDKTKLDGIANNANNYVHPTTSGNKHIPSGGSSGKILGWSADGTAAWIDEPSKGTVTSVEVGSTSYSPSSGVVSLPQFITYGTVGSFTGSLASLVVRDGSFVLKGSVFYVGNVFFTTISNISANVETMLATVSVKPKYDTKTIVTISKNDNSSVLTDNAVLQIKADGSVTLKSPVAIGSGSNAGRINNARVIDLSI